MIFLFPLVLSVVGALFFLLSDAAWVTKLAVLLLAIAALVLQFGTTIAPVVPVLIQVALCIGLVIHFQMDQMR